MITYRFIQVTVMLSAHELFILPFMMQIFTSHICRALSDSVHSWSLPVEAEKPHLLFAVIHVVQTVLCKWVREERLQSLHPSMNEIGSWNQACASMWPLTSSHLCWEQMQRRSNLRLCSQSLPTSEGWVCAATLGRTQLEKKMMHQKGTNMHISALCKCIVLIMKLHRASCIWSLEVMRSTSSRPF